jgi:CheY-like chemotaxis protein
MFPFPIAPGASEPPRVLIVDDDRDVHDAYERCLAPPRRESEALARARDELFGPLPSSATGEAPQFELAHAYGGEEGVRTVQRQLAAGRPFAAAFVDMRMPPGWNGVDTIKGIWRLDPAVQIVLSTAYSDFTWDKVLAAVGRSAGLHLLRKPFDPAQVLRFAEVLCRKWQLAAESRLIASGLQR